MARVRLADVAERVGVSPKTVSNVVNGTGWVGEAVRAQVLAAIEELGYRPNLAARQLRGGSSGLLGLSVPNLREPYFAEFASEFVSSAEQRGLTVLITQTHGHRAAELAMLEGADLPALDGLVLSPLRITRDDIAARRSSVPLVLIGEHGETLASDDVAHVGPDNIAAAQQATRYLLDHGCRRIAAIGVQSRATDTTAKLRLEGYRRALTDAGVPLDVRLLIEVDAYNRAEGSQGIETLIERGIEFDGVFCFNDSMAFGALYTLGAHGIRVPDEVRVIGYDAIEEGIYSTPPFATIDPGVASATTMILDLLTGPRGNLAGHIEVPFHVVER